MMNRLFFELMQVSTGQLDCLSRGPSPEEWQELYTLAREQNVVGACYQGTVRLFDFGLRAPQNLIIDWMNEAEDLREQCQQTEQSYLALLKKLNERSLRYSVITGQGMTYYYTDELHDLRRPNGIDIFVHGGKDLLLSLGRQRFALLPPSFLPCGGIRQTLRVVQRQPHSIGATSAAVP